MSLAIRYTNVGVESNSQMREFDAFGPRARAAFNYGPRDPDVKTFRSRFVQNWNRNHLDNDGGLTRQCVLTDPDIDQMFAAYIDKIIVERTGQPIAWHDLKPKRMQRPYRSRPTKLFAGRSRR